MGNQIDKVLPGLYVGGFLGEIRGSAVSPQSVPSLALCLTCGVIFQARTERRSCKRTK